MGGRVVDFRTHTYTRNIIIAHGLAAHVRHYQR